jgi:hypothetical protein
MLPDIERPALRAVMVACAVGLAAAAFGCGGSDGGEPTGGPLSPGPVQGPGPGPSPGAPPPAGTAHGYYDWLSGREDVVASYSLRDQAMLDAYAKRGAENRPFSISYDFANDPDARKQDAAKVTVPANQVSASQLRLPIPAVGNTSLLVTWDAWWGKEFAYGHAQIGNYKAFQFASPTNQIWTEVKSDFDLARRFPSALAMVNVRSYGKPGETIGSNVTDKNPLSPQSADFGIAAETWTRYWAYFNPQGEWHEFSLWVADENRQAVLILDRLQLKPNVERGATGWQSFWLEYNTSAGRIPESRGPLVAYARNVVMLRGVSDPVPLLQRPVP